MSGRKAADVLGAIVVVLVTPRDATNVGGVVRVMGNFGLRHLRLVEPATFDLGRTLAVAHRGAAVAETVARYASLAEATADCGLVVGTTARPRAVRHEVVRPWQAASTLLSGARAGATVALVFGPEDAGLTNEHLGLCHAVSVIPTAVGDASLNLAQAVLVHAYELWLHAADLSGAAPRERMGTLPAAVASLESGDSGGGDPLAPGWRREQMFGALEQMVWAMYPHTDAGRAGATMARLRALLVRGAPRSDEVQLLTTMFTHIAHALRRQPGAGHDTPSPREGQQGGEGPSPT